jgi:branched-chain amino acid transport system substrate-binding protein
MKIFRLVRTGIAIIALIVLGGCKSMGLNPAGSGTPTVTIQDTTVIQSAPSQPASPRKTLKIVSSMPLTGVALTVTESVVNAQELRLAEANGQACGGKYKLEYEAWDDASALHGQWDPDVEIANANKAAADHSVIAYLGPFNSGAAKLSIPILDEAGPLVMISPANTYPGLTKPGYGQGEPEMYYPAKTRNYARVVATDDVQGKVDANFMFTQLGVKSVYILDDQPLYGKGVSDVFEATAKSLGMNVLGHEGIDPTALDYRALTTKIAGSNNGQPPDGIFIGMTVDSNAAKLLSDKVIVMGDNTKVKFMGPDGIKTQAMIDGSSASIAEGIYSSVAGLPQEKWNAAGQRFLTEYRAKYGKLTEPFAIYGYEAINILLQAIENVCAAGSDPSNRMAVRDAVFAIRNFDGVLGTWSFDANGDTSISDMTIYQVENGTFEALGTFK